MKRLPLVAAAGLLGLGLAGAVTPTFAASIASCQNDVSNSTTGGQFASPIDQNAAAILAGLKDRGIDATDVSNWGGCVKADVVRKDGRMATEFFDPASLQRLRVRGG